MNGQLSDIRMVKQESRAVARKPRDALAVVFALNFTVNIHYKFKSSQASKAMAQTFCVKFCFAANILARNRI